MANEPATVWNPTDGNGEFSFPGVAFVVDPSGTFLVDPSGVFIVDTGVMFNQIPATIWTQDDSQ